MASHLAGIKTQLAEARRAGEGMVLIITFAEMT